jgi:hypothetical protein
MKASVGSDYLCVHDRKYFLKYSKMILKVFFIWFAIKSVVSQNISVSTTGERFKRQNSVCGVASPSARSLIDGSETFSRGSWPWMVALMHKTPAKPLKFFCSGTLVTNRKVVTGEKVFS